MPKIIIKTEIVPYEIQHNLWHMVYVVYMALYSHQLDIC